MTKYEENIQNLIDATSFREPARVPVGGSFYGWPFARAGTTYRDVMDDPEKAAQAYTKGLEGIEFSCYMDMGMAQPVAPNQALGNFTYAIGEDGIVIRHDQVNDVYFGPEIYDTIINDTQKFISDTLFKIKYPKLNQPREKAYEAVKEAIAKYRAFADMNAMIADYVQSTMNACPLMGASPILFATPINAIFDYVKKSFDTFAPGGGFIFSPNASLMSAADAKVENVIATYETANELCCQ